MKRLLFILLLIIPFIGFGQLNLLDKKNGFKNIKLGTNVLKYGFIKKISPHIEFSFGQGTISHPFIGEGSSFDLTEGLIFHEGVKECNLWIVDTENRELHTFPRNTKIKKILIETYNNLILSITLYIDDDITRTIPLKLVEVFGSPTKNRCRDIDSFEVDKKEICSLTWTTNKVNLSVISCHNFTERWRTSYDQERDGWVIQYEDIKLNSIVDNIKLKIKERYKQKLKDQF